MVLRFQYEIRCTAASADAMGHYMEVARKCYEQGRGVIEAKLIQLPGEEPGTDLGQGRLCKSETMTENRKDGDRWAKKST